MSEGDYGLHIWSGLGTDPQRTLLDQKLLLTRPSKEGGVTPKPPDPCCTVARLDVSLFTTVWPTKNYRYTASSFTHGKHLWSTTFTFLRETSQEKKSTESVIQRKAKEEEEPFNLHTASAFCGFMLLSAARLALTEQHWYPQTCKKTPSRSHVMSFEEVGVNFRRLLTPA